jgi:hypothetical protein
MAITGPDNLEGTDTGKLTAPFATAALLSASSRVLPALPETGTKKISKTIQLQAIRGRAFRRRCI